MRILPILPINTNTTNKQKGQVLIVVILILLVVSVVVLAAASRSITDVKISQTSEESARAFSAAEAGVEEAAEKIRAGTVTIGAPGNISLSNNATATYVVTEQGSSTQSFLSSTPLAGDTNGFQVYLANRDGSNPYTGSSICIVWGNEGTLINQSDAPSLSVKILYKELGGNIALQGFALDPSGRNGFTSANNDASCAKNILAVNNNLNIDRTFAFAHKLTWSLPGGAVPLILAIRPLRNVSQGHYIGVTPPAGVLLPPQGYKISSTGSSSQTTRKVDVFEAYPAMQFLNFILFNFQGGLQK